MHVQYDGVDWVARLVRYLVDLVQDDLSFTTAGSSVNDWGELLAVKPRTYLRLSLAMDLSMSSGRFPEKKDFLARLDGLRLGRSAKVLRALNEPNDSSRVEEERQVDQQTASARNSPMAIDFGSLIAADRSGGCEDVTADASAGGAQDHTAQPQGLFTADSELYRFPSFSNESDDFFGPTLGELGTASESSNSEGTYEGDIDTTFLAG